MSAISVILISWNNARHAAETVRSIAAQTMRDFEVINVDNGSTDGSADVIAQTAGDVALPLQQIRLDSNHGIPAALNTAIGRSRGEYLVSFAADDVMDPDRLEVQRDALERAGAGYGAVVGDVRLIDDDGVPMLDGAGEPRATSSPWLLDEEHQFLNLLRGRSPAAPTAMIRRTVYNELGGYDETMAIEDRPLWLRLTRTSKILYRPGVVVSYRRHTGSVSRNAVFMRRAGAACLLAIDRQGLSPTELEVLHQRLNSVQAELRLHTAAQALVDQLPGVRRLMARLALDREQCWADRVRAAASVASPGLARLVLRAGATK